MTISRNILYVIERKINGEWGVARSRTGPRIYLDLERCIKYLDRSQLNWSEDPDIRIVAYKRSQVIAGPKI